MTGPERKLAALEQLRADVAEGRVENRSREWYRRREEARRLDPAYVAQRREYFRARQAKLKGDDAQAVSYRSAMAERSTRARIEREQQRAERRKYQCVQKRPHMVRAKTLDEQRIEAVVAAAQGAQCAGYTVERGWRIRCVLPGDHEGRCAHRKTA